MRRTGGIEEMMGAQIVALIIFFIVLLTGVIVSAQLPSNFRVIGYFLSFFIAAAAAFGVTIIISRKRLIIRGPRKV